MAESYETPVLYRDHKLLILDQTRLPGEEIYICLLYTSKGKSSEAVDIVKLCKFITVAKGAAGGNDGIIQKNSAKIDPGIVILV